MLVGDLSKLAPHGIGWMKPFREQGMAAAELELMQSCFEDDPEHRPTDAGDLARRIEELEKPPPPPFETDMKEALEEMRTKGNTRTYFERQGPTRLGAWQAAAQQGDGIAQ